MTTVLTRTLPHRIYAWSWMTIVIQILIMYDRNLCIHVWIRWTDDNVCLNERSYNMNGWSFLSPKVCLAIKLHAKGNRALRPWEQDLLGTIFLANTKIKKFSNNSLYIKVLLLILFQYVNWIGSGEMNGKIDHRNAYLYSNKKMLKESYLNNYKRFF